MRALPESPTCSMHFDQLTDQPERFLAWDHSNDKVLRKNGQGPFRYATCRHWERYEELHRLVRMRSSSSVRAMGKRTSDRQGG